MELSSGPQALQDEKARLELERLHLEVVQLKAPWWKKPPYLAVLVPIAISTFTFISVWSTGWFDQKRIQLAGEKKQLDIEVKSLKIEKRGLQNDKIDLAAKLTSIQNEVTIAKKIMRVFFRRK